MAYYAKINIWKYMTSRQQECMRKLFQIRKQKLHTDVYHGP